MPFYNETQPAKASQEYDRGVRQVVIYTLVLCVCVCAGAPVLHPRDGPHHREGVRDGLLPHADRRAQPPGLGLPQEPLRHRRCQVSPTFTEVESPSSCDISFYAL